MGGIIRAGGIAVLIAIMLVLAVWTVVFAVIAAAAFAPLAFLVERVLGASGIADRWSRDLIGLRTPEVAAAFEDPLTDQELRGDRDT